MNQIAWQIYGGSNRKSNTFIGGVASTITTSGALATRLGIASNRITNFKIVGSDIECRISGSYGIPQFCTGIELLISYYRDFDGLVTSIGSLAFYWTNVREVYMPNATSIGLGAFDQNGSIGQDKNSLKILYIPRVTTIGTTALNNNVFRANTGKPKIYAHPSLQTINSGGVEGDLALAIADGATVIYVSNFTAPNPITNLSVGTIYGTAIQLNFTAPIGSTNAIDYYEVWQNGVNTGKTVTASGQYITGLTLNTTYTFQLIPVDIFYNKSTSNVISVTTATTYNIPTTNIVSYYKMENNVIDSWGTNNGTATAIIYASGLVGQSAVFNGSTSFITIPDSDSLTFANATNDLPFSIGYSIKTSDTQFWILEKNSASTREYECFYSGGKLGFRLVSNGNAANRLDQLYTIPMAGAWINVIHTYNGLGNGGMKTYVNGVLVISTNILVGTYVKMGNTTNPVTMGKHNPSAGYELNGQLDEVSIWNAELTVLQITEINAKLNTGQSLI